MNWYKIAQDVSEQYNKLIEDPSSDVAIIGSGVGQTLIVPGASKSITAKELMDHVKRRLAGVLSDHSVRTIDTSPIAQANAQGLAMSHEPGTIHVDVAKIFNAAKGSLPPTAQLDGASGDPDIINGMIDKIAFWIEGELTETLAHEKKHMRDYRDAYQNKKPFTSVEEAPGDQFGKKIRQQYFHDEPKTFGQ